MRWEHLLETRTEYPPLTKSSSATEIMRVCRQLAKEHPVMDLFMHIVNLLDVSSADYYPYAREFRFVFKGTYKGHNATMHIVFTVAEKGSTVGGDYLVSTLRMKPKKVHRVTGKPSIYAEMAGLQSANTVRPGVIRVVRGYGGPHGSPANTYGTTLVGWPLTHQREWVRDPKKMLDAMAEFLDENVQYA